MSERVGRWDPVAGIGVLDYQINMMTAPPVPPQVVAQSPSGGVAPVVGGAGQCLRSPYPLPVVVKIDKDTPALRFEPVIAAVSEAGGELVHMLKGQDAPGK